MDKKMLLRLVEQARKRVESSDETINDQHRIIAALEGKGLNSDEARAILARLITAQDTELAEMERLLDIMDREMEC
ncbi:MAG: hypothetical protein AB7S92_03130 [Parvibaculaceae bacterium]